MTPPTPHTEPCRVAVLPAGSTEHLGFAAYFSAREWRHLAHIAHQGRSTRWLAGRLAAKYLFLSHQQHGQAPAFQTLTPAALRTFATADYQQVEVLTAEASGSRAPRLWWQGVPHAACRVSLSHTADTTCACLALDGALGIDLEQTIPRRDAFYRGNFFPADERAWVAHHTADAAQTAPWLFTLLWTLKEAALKAQVLGRPLSVWDFPRLEVRLGAEARRLAVFARSTRLGDAFLDGTAHLAVPPHQADVRILLTATRHLILTVLTR